LLSHNSQGNSTEAQRLITQIKDARNRLLAVEHSTSNKHEGHQCDVVDVESAHALTKHEGQ